MFTLFYDRILIYTIILGFNAIIYKVFIAQKCGSSVTVPYNVQGSNHESHVHFLQIWAKNLWHSLFMLPNYTSFLHSDSVILALSYLGISF